jgi:hypothetical protein
MGIFMGLKTHAVVAYRLQRRRPIVPEIHRKKSPPTGFFPHRSIIVERKLEIEKFDIRDGKPITSVRGGVG